MTNAAESGRFRIGGAFDVNRLGFGAMRIVGKGIWGPPADRAEALKTLRRLPDLGVDFIDTADSYGPNFSEELIREALAPYGKIHVATKGGLTRTGAEHLDPARPAGISDPAGAYEPLAARRRDHRSVAIASHRFESAGQGAVRRHRLADQGQGHPLRGSVGSERRRDRGGPEGLPGRDGAEPLQFHRPHERGGARLLREAQHRLHPLGAARRWRVGKARLGAGRDCAQAQGEPRPDRARLALEAQPGHAADPRHRQGRASRGERRRGGDQAHGRGVRNPRPRRTRGR